ncbi:hypothetical protein Ptr902_08330 [Pyrenophora tritici-repentis]|nr:hypothetical protein Ptr902_08330 [Pyrenophora tritici-repentis]
MSSSKLNIPYFHDDKKGNAIPCSISRTELATHNSWPLSTYNSASMQRSWNFTNLSPSSPEPRTRRSRLQLRDRRRAKRTLRASNKISPTASTVHERVTSLETIGLQLSSLSLKVSPTSQSVEQRNGNATSPKARCGREATVHGQRSLPSTPFFLGPVSLANPGEGLVVSQIRDTRNSMQLSLLAREKIPPL